LGPFHVYPQTNAKAVVNMARQINNVLFVCTGNICRSPFAEALLKNLLDQEGLEGIRADSAGLLALPGRFTTPLAQRVAAEFGVDLSESQAKSLSQDLVAWSDLVLVMEKSHEEALLSAFPETAGKILLLRHFARHGSRRRGTAANVSRAHKQHVIDLTGHVNDGFGVRLRINMEGPQVSCLTSNHLATHDTPLNHQ